MSTPLKFETDTAPSTASVLPETSRHGVQDRVNHGPATRVADELTTAHPLEARLTNWDNSQLGIKLHMQRRVYGLHAPMRTMMELQAVGQTPSLLNSRASQIQRDILLGRDETFDMSDLYNDCSEVELDVHRMLAARLNV
ncbi:proteasome maturation factor UMP1 [Coemansia reversa NRRL 1564]|uniref:Proteasome maturation factor UMP1 n=1 Tax=Coemansia reversa (strain ATCC 12441 / NRRL 1564) TaxID=763665 RepID=A0A2G5BG24_COERN|nr:proteasome maturation factor UMP1 [Coemansia reversa NRRL 1564]|eukprot:PIA17667.1 proteasome maturation factor UMP1 [Coemansia reversa NRRL 1564]